MSEKIDIKHIDLKYEKNFETIEAFIELHENYFRYASKYYCDELKNKDDEGMGWDEGKFHQFDLKIKRKNIVSLEINWASASEVWNVEIEVNGYPSSINIYYKTEKEAEALHNKLFNYIFEK